MTQQDWSRDLTLRIGQNIKKVRGRKKLSAQKLADGCEAAGMVIPRDVIANVENGRREAISIAEIIVIAAVLGVSPITLIYPPDQASTPVMTPAGDSQLTWEALKAFTGESNTPGTEGSDSDLLNSLRTLQSREDTVRYWLRQESHQREAELDPSEQNAASLAPEMHDRALQAVRTCLFTRQSIELFAGPSAAPPIATDLANIYAELGEVPS